MSKGDWGRAAALASALAPLEGPQGCRVEGVTLMRHTRDRIKIPVLYGPSLMFVVQGVKRAILGSRTFVYDQERYLILTGVVPFMWSLVADEEHPVLSVFVHLRADLVLELMGAMDPDSIDAKGETPALLEEQRTTEELGHAVLRLLQAAADPRDSRVLGAAIAREIVYRALCGPGGSGIRAVSGRDGHFTQIASAVRSINANLSRPLSVPALAAGVGMSPSVFHLHFKQVTNSSPLQYVKALRLHQGRTLMLTHGIGVAEAAEQVGYESSSQFSREYKRTFGEAPAVAMSRRKPKTSP